MTAEPYASIMRTARLAGGLYLSLVPLGIFSFVYVPSVLFVRGNAAATSRNIVASEWLFRSSVISHLLSQITRAVPGAGDVPASQACEQGARSAHGWVSP